MKLLIIFALLAHLNETQKSPSFLVANRPVGQVGEPSWFGGYFSMENIQVKTCVKCGIEKSVKEFQLNKTRNYINARRKCSTCCNFLKQEVRRSKVGTINKIYETQKRKAKSRGMSPPSYSKKWLSKWLLDQQLFHDLHQEWVNSSYSRMKVPSVDRIDDYVSYTKSNIQLMTWEDNMNKNFRDIKAGKNTKTVIPVLQMDLLGNIISEFHSCADAKRKTGIPSDQISHCCRGKSNTCHGFKWRYKD